MKPIEAYCLIREACSRRPELKYRDWQNPRMQYVPEDQLGLRPYTGYCYVATQVFCYMIPEAKPYCFPGRGHFYAMIDDKIWDLTAEQFPSIRDYSIGIPTKFKTPLCERAEELYDECCCIN